MLLNHGFVINLSLNHDFQTIFPSPNSMYIPDWWEVMLSDVKLPSSQLMIPNHDFMIICYHIKWGWFYGSKCCVISCWSKEKQGEGARFQRGEGEGEREGEMFSTINPGHTIMHSDSMAQNRTQVHSREPHLTLYARETVSEREKASARQR